MSRQLKIIDRDIVTAGSPQYFTPERRSIVWTGTIALFFWFEEKKAIIKLLSVKLIIINKGRFCHV